VVYGVRKLLFLCYLFIGSDIFVRLYFLELSIKSTLIAEW